MFAFLKRLFGTAQSRILKKNEKIVAQINRLEDALHGLDDEQIRAKTDEFKERLKKGESLDAVLPEAYAVVKNVCRRLQGSDVHVSGYSQRWDMIPYDVQILGALALDRGYIAEMQTGEGKTLTCTMPLYLHALTGKPVHIVTVNDYLALRDCEWVGSIFRWLGLKTGVLTQDLSYYERKAIYECDIVYGTASEFGFDYLRDNSVATSGDEQVQRGHYFALIDEIDSILIDEARTPLIISGPSPHSRQLYDSLKDISARLVDKQKEELNQQALVARKRLERHFFGQEKVHDLDEDAGHDKPLQFDKEDDEALKKLWLVSKGTPRNKILKRLREHPDIRARIDKWDLYYYSEQNKEERAQMLAKLFIIVDEKANEYELTDRGISCWQECGGHEDDFVMLDLGHEFLLIDQNELSDEEKRSAKLALQEEDAHRKERAHNLRQLLRAHLMMERDVDYIVQDAKVIIIDENTGRPQPGRRFSDGLHQAIEAKERVAIQQETQTFATVTLQNYFRLYQKLAGMTGTAITEAHEFKEIYKLDVLQIPTHKTCRRADANDEMYMTEREKYNAILKEVKEIHGQGRPILLGTESVEVSEKLSRIFRLNRLEHTVLNAKNNAKEAEIIAQAGQRGAITIATNMAGRGTDIKLGEGIAAIGGLHVVGSTRHQSRRIDRQLRGRSGRQGDPGSSKFFISLEDPLMRLFASPSITALLQRFRPPENEPIAAPILNRSIETAQKRIEGRNFLVRKHTLEYDDVMNKQRHELYSYRNDLLHTKDPMQMAEEIFSALCCEDGALFFQPTKGGYDPEGYRNYLAQHLPVTLESGCFDQDHRDADAPTKMALAQVLAQFRGKIAAEKAKAAALFIHQPIEVDTILQNAVRGIMIRTTDHLWQEHLLAMDHLRSDVHLRVVGQKDPLVEFKHESFLLFEKLSRRIREQMAHALFKFEIVPQKVFHLNPVTPPNLHLESQRSLFSELASEEEEEAPAEPTARAPTPLSPIVAEPRAGRNDTCPCGSGKKYKKCCATAVDV